MAEEYRKFDASDNIKTAEDARGLLRAATEEDVGDGVVIRAALKHLARTQNMSALARDTGLNRGNLYEALSENGNPTLATLLKVTGALGLRLRLEPVETPIDAAHPPSTRISRQSSRRLGFGHLHRCPTRQSPMGSASRAKSRRRRLDWRLRERQRGEGVGALRLVDRNRIRFEPTTSVTPVRRLPSPYQLAEPPRYLRRRA